MDQTEILFHGSVLHFKDERHSSHETRFIAVGLVEERYIVVAFTYRQKGAEKLIRPISVRYMHKKEREAYENIKKNLSQE